MIVIVTIYQWSDACMQYKYVSAHVFEGLDMSAL